MQILLFGLASSELGINALTTNTSLIALPLLLVIIARQRNQNSAFFNENKN